MLAEEDPLEAILLCGHDDGVPSVFAALDGRRGFPRLSGRTIRYGLIVADSASDPAKLHRPKSGRCPARDLWHLAAAGPCRHKALRLMSMMGKFKKISIDFILPAVSMTCQSR